MKQTLMEKISYWAEAACDLVLLNLLWLACCLPILTIGASTTALHYVMRKMAVGEPYTVWSSFWHSFRANWKQATALWMILGIGGVICAADLYIGQWYEGWIGLACQIIGVLGLIVIVCALMLVFPLLARYTQRIPSLLKNALILSFTKPYVVIAGIAAAAVFPALVLLNEHLLVIATPGWLLVGGSLTALVLQILLRPVLAQLEKPIPMEEANHGSSETETHP